MKKRYTRGKVEMFIFCTMFVSGNVHMLLSSYFINETIPCILGIILGNLLLTASGIFLDHVENIENCYQHRYIKE